MNSRMNNTINKDRARAAAEDMLSFVEKSPCMFFAVKNMADTLEAAGFSPLLESEAWKIVPGGRYFVTRNDSALIAFALPKGKLTGFQIGASHSDQPALKIKEAPEIRADYTTLNVELYGGAILSTWLDRPLSVAGRVVIEENGLISTQLVNINKDLLVIPSLAIHMDRKVNEGHAYNVQKDMLPLFGGKDAQSLKDMVADLLKVAPSHILGSDLFLYTRTAPSIWGAETEFMSSARLDDLECGYASLRGILDCTPADSAAVHCVFDNEEVGSATKQGAASTFLKDTLMRITSALGGTDDDYRRMVASSFMLSADNAHAVHPNYTEKADPVHHPAMNNGVVIKYSANQKYTTDAVSAALVKALCEHENIPYQVFVNRSDVPGGSTLGNLSGNQVAVNTADVGLAQLAMHSAYETAGVYDVSAMTALMKLQYSSSIDMTGAGSYRMLLP